MKRRGGPDLDLSRQAAQTDLRSQRPLPAGVCASPHPGRWPGESGSLKAPGQQAWESRGLPPVPCSRETRVSRAPSFTRGRRPPGLSFWRGHRAPQRRCYGPTEGRSSRAPQRRGGCCRAVPQQGPRGPSRATPPPPPAPLPAARLRARRRPATRPLRRLAARLQLSQPVSQRPLTAPRLGPGGTPTARAGRGGDKEAEGGKDAERGRGRRRGRGKQLGEGMRRQRSRKREGGHPGTSSSSECLEVRPAQGYLRLPGVWPAARGTLSW